MRAALIILILVACEPPAPAPQARPSELPASAPAKHPSSSTSEDASPGTMASSARPELDAGSASPCEGVHVDITTAITDARCVFYEEDRAEALRKSYERQFGAAPPKVDGRVLDDGQLELTLTNASATPLVLPLFLSSAIDLYSVTARRSGKVVTLKADHSPKAWTAKWDRGRNFAQLVIAPRGTATVKLTLDPTIIEKQYRCPPNAKCAPTETNRGPLPVGTWELEVALPVYGVPPPKATFAFTKR